MQAEFDINNLVREAHDRWLRPAEVYFILQNHENFQMREAPPQKPTSGSFFLYNKRVVRCFRNDGHSWRKKNASRSVREGHERLKVGNVEALNCYYAHGDQDPYFQRRSFWMLDKAFEHIVLVHYRDATKGKCNAEGVYFSPNYSLASTTSSYGINDRGSIAVISEPYQSSSFSPRSVEINSELNIWNNVINHTGEISRVVQLADNGYQIHENFEEQFSMNGDRCRDFPPYIVESTRLKGSEIQKDKMSSNEAEHLALQYVLDSSKSRQLPVVDAGHSNYLNMSDFVQSTEALSWNVVPEDCTGSCWNDLQDRLLSTLDQIGPNGPGNYTDDMQSSQPTVNNDFESQFSEAMPLPFGSDNCMSPSTISLLQAPDYPKISAHCSGVGMHGETSNSYFDQMNQLEVSRGTESRLILAQKPMFRIREISPEWGISTENTKVIIIGSFLCDPSECTWCCMFGEIEVPIQIIQEGVICAQAPPHGPGKVTVCITSSNRESCSEIREFEYRSMSSTCDNCSSPQRDATKNTDELLFLVRLVHMLLCDSLVLKEDNTKSISDTLGLIKAREDLWQDIIEALLVGIEIQHNTKDWLLQEVLKDKLQFWLLSKYKEGYPSDYFLTKKEKGIIHLVAALGFEWALTPVLRCGVNVNYRDINGHTALHWAARFGREKMVAALIAAGASAGAVTDPTSQDPVGQTPGSAAAASGHKGLAGYLSEVALANHLSYLSLQESEVLNGSLNVEMEKTLKSISKWGINSSDDHLSLKDSLAASRNSTQIAARIQSYFNVNAFKRRQAKESASVCCDEYGISPDELAAASKLALERFHNRMWDKAALSIQKNYRGRKTRQEFLALRQKIMMIQAHVRGYWARKMYTKILWAVGILDKVVLRWSRKRVGLRGFHGDPNSVGESDYEDILQAFRNLKVYQAVDQALSLVLSMVESPEAREQYRRMLESYGQVKADIFDNTNGASTSQLHS